MNSTLVCLEFGEGKSQNWKIPEIQFFLAERPEASNGSANLRVRVLPDGEKERMRSGFSSPAPGIPWSKCLDGG